MTSFSAKWTILAVKKNALAYVRLHVTFCSLCRLASAIAKRAIRLCDFNQPSARTDWALLDVGLSHLFYVKDTII